MRALLMPIALILISFSFIDAQNIWIGGFPGDETNWDNPRNWSLNKVPDLDKHVIIPDMSTHGSFYPVIDKEINEIPSLELGSNAKIEITKTGILTIDGSCDFDYGISGKGNLVNNGLIRINNTGLAAIQNEDQNILFGHLVIDGLSNKSYGFIAGGHR